MRFYLKIIIFICGFMGFVSCSTPQSRIQERPEVFRALSTDQKNAVSKGGLTKGMSGDAVYIAVGHPYRIVKTTEKNKMIERWIYSEISSHEIPVWYGAETSKAGDANFVFRRDYQPFYINREEDSFEVDFEDGKVVGWKVFKSPSPLEYKDK